MNLRINGFNQTFTFNRPFRLEVQPTSRPMAAGIPPWMDGNTLLSYLSLTNFTFLNTSKYQHSVKPVNGSNDFYIFYIFITIYCQETTEDDLAVPSLTTRHWSCYTIPMPIIGHSDTAVCVTETLQSCKQLEIQSIVKHQ